MGGIQLISFVFLFILFFGFGASGQTKTIINNDVTIANRGSLVVAENDTLIITGNVVISNGADFSIEQDAVCIIYGNLEIKNSVSLSVGAILIVGGNYKAPAGADKVDVYVDPLASIYILGTVDDKSGDFDCNNTSYYLPPGDVQCNYGDIISMEDNENDSTGIYDFFVSGDANKGVTPVYSELCGEGTVTISALLENASAYQWCDSIGDPISGETSYQFTVDQPGEYFVKITTGGETYNSHRAKVVGVSANSSPVANCKSDLTVYLDANGEAAITPEMIDNGSTDDCGIASMSVSPKILSCTNLFESGGDNNYTVSAQSVDGNTTVNISFTNMKLELSQEWENTYNAYISFDYSIEVLGTPVRSFYTNQLHFYTITNSDQSGDLNLNGTSGSGTTSIFGLSGTYSSDISIEDVTTSIKLMLGFQTQTYSEFPNTYIPLTRSAGQQVMLTVADYSGNTNTCATSVTVLDTIKPSITCPGDITDEVDAGLDYATNVDLGELAATDTTDNCTIESVTNNAPVQFPLGNTNVVWTVTDASGNMATCTQEVTIITVDTIDVRVEQPSAICNAADGQINFVGTTVTTPISFIVDMTTSNTDWSPAWEITFTLIPGSGATLDNIGASGGTIFGSGPYTVTGISSTGGIGSVEITMEVSGDIYTPLTVELNITEAKTNNNIEDKDSDNWEAIQTVNAIPNTGPIITN